MLVPGDVFVVDNAKLHKAASIVQALADALDTVNVRLVFLPTYSPEFNPCELVFAQVKNYLRAHRGSSAFSAEVIKAFAQVSREHVFGYYMYRKCISVDSS
jgi:transposase